MTLDRRLHAFRPDLADAQLEGTVAAQAFVAGRPAHATLGIVPLKERPDWESPLSTELVFGEKMRVFEERDGWAWVQAAGDGYVGYAPLDGLEMAAGRAATHHVSVLASFLYAEPDLKSMPLDSLPLTAELCLTGEEAGSFAQVSGGGWIFARHAATLETLGSDFGGDFVTDFVGEAERFLGAPYLWGGKSSRGIDCSGLVQVALRAAGSAAPRDTDLQAASLGVAVEIEAPRRPGDLIYFPGHVGIITDGETLLHANAFSMTVAREPLAAVRARLRDTPISAVRRLA